MRILGLGRANGLKFTSDCLTLIFYLFICTMRLLLLYVEAQSKPIFVEATELQYLKTTYYKIVLGINCQMWTLLFLIWFVSCNKDIMVIRNVCTYIFYIYTNFLQLHLVQKWTGFYLKHSHCPKLLWICTIYSTMNLRFSQNQHEYQCSCSSST